MLLLVGGDYVQNINSVYDDVCTYREEAFQKNLWEKMSSYVFENIYIPAAQADNTGYQSNITHYLLYTAHLVTAVITGSLRICVL